MHAGINKITTSTPQQQQKTKRERKREKKLHTSKHNERNSLFILIDFKKHSNEYLFIYYGFFFLLRSFFFGFVLAFCAVILAFSLTSTTAIVCVWVSAFFSHLLFKRGYISIKEITLECHLFVKICIQFVYGLG